MVRRGPTPGDEEPRHKQEQKNEISDDQRMAGSMKRNGRKKSNPRTQQETNQKGRRDSMLERNEANEATADTVPKVSGGREIKEG